MEEWEPNLKHYRHFDKPIPKRKIRAIVTNPKRVAQNTFFPFLCFAQEFKRFGRNPKERLIRYAGRCDAYIFAYYRHILSVQYEKKLEELGIQECPIAYRKIPVEIGKESGKCNIHFAKEAFSTIKNLGPCYAIVLDISNYFESIDHKKLEQLWCELLGKDSLPEDHQAVFKAVTQYAVVDQQKCYERLGYFGDVTVNDISKRGLTLNPKDIPIQLCSLEDFRKKICGDDPNYSSLIEKNKKDYGIPQGSPISDLLANLYLLYFDKEMKSLAVRIGAYYRRYSDDILFICPPDHEMVDRVMKEMRTQISKAGKNLVIKPEKTNIIEFFMDKDSLKCQPYSTSDKDKPLEYLGFAFDGQVVSLKGKTISGYYRKMTFGVRKKAKALVAQYPDKTPEQILEHFDLSPLYQKYGKIEDFMPSFEYKNWNFWTYAKRADDIMKPFNNIILRQLRNHKKKIRTLLEQEIVHEYIKRKSVLAV